MIELSEQNSYQEASLFLLRFERVAGGSAGIDLWSHSPLPQGQGRAECEL